MIPSSHLIDMRPARVAGQHLFAVNDPAPHSLSRISTGTDLSDYTRVVCTCGWQGPKRYERENDQMSRLLEDARGHRIP